MEDLTQTEQDMQLNHENRSIDDIFEWLFVIPFLILTLMISMFLFRNVKVDGWSMLPTLRDKDHLILSNYIFTEPRKGDIIVISADKLSYLESKFIIKRVIATTGDRVRFNFEAGEVYLNDELLHEPYINGLTTRHLDMQSDVEVTVPDHCVYVLGDNRDNSTDSRSNAVGFVDFDHIVGNATVCYWPSDRWQLFI